MPGAPFTRPIVLEEIQEKDWNLVVDVNLKGTFLCCQAVIPEMARQGKGVIVNMSALAGHWRASLAGVQYVAAKAGVEGLTRQLAYDWGKSGIRVNAIAPTVTLTGRPDSRTLGGEERGREKEGSFRYPPGSVGNPGGSCLRRRFSGVRRIQLHHRDYHRCERGTVSSVGD